LFAGVELAYRAGDDVRLLGAVSYGCGEVLGGRGKGVHGPFFYYIRVNR
jgi:hypothetical protein